MSVIRLICISALLVILTLISAACTQSPVGSREGNQRVAEEFVRLETTFRFDGIPETLKLTSTTSVANGWKYTIEFDSRHAGEMVIKVTKKPPLVSRDQVRTIAADVTVDNSRTKRELGYTPANLHEGLEKSVFWLQQSGYLAVRV